MIILKPRYIKVKVEHYLLFMFSPPKNKLCHFRNKIHLFTFTFCLLSNPALQWTNNHLFWFAKTKWCSAVFYVPCLKPIRLNYCIGILNLSWYWPTFFIILKLFVIPKMKMSQYFTSNVSIWKNRKLPSL